jgi:hypothetical protein
MAYWKSNREPQPKKKFTIPKINGRVGFSFYIGMKEVFIGIAFADVILEQILRKRTVKLPKAETRTYGFDIFSQGSDTNSED